MKLSSFFLLTSSLILLSCSSETQVDLLSLSLDNYKPVDEFVDAYEAISSQPGLQ